MRRHQQLPSCTGDHFTAAATTTPVPAASSPQKQILVLHQQLPVLHQRSPSCTSRHQRPLSYTSSNQFCTSDRLPAPADTSGHFPAPADTSGYQSCTSDRLPTPADISNYQFWTSEHLPAPADTSPKPATNEYQSCTSCPDLLQRLDPVPTITIRPRWLFAVSFLDLRFATIKFGFSKKTLVLSSLPSSLSITYISKVCGDQYIYLTSATI